MEANTIQHESGPGWRELLEALYEASQTGREREAVLLRLIEQDREALGYLWRRGRLARVGQGRDALPPGHNETGRSAKEKSYGQTASQ